MFEIFDHAGTTRIAINMTTTMTLTLTVTMTIIITRLVTGTINMRMTMTMTRMINDVRDQYTCFISIMVTILIGPLNYTCFKHSFLRLRLET